MLRRGDADWTPRNDTESLSTVHAHPAGLSSSAPVESEVVLFDFSNDLQRSRVYRRNQALCEPVISVITNSVYSLGWSIFSDLSLSEVSNISVINLAITDRETLNPTRSSQTWSTQPKHGAYAGPYTYEHRDGQRTQSLEVIREPVPANTSANYQEGLPAFTQIQQQRLSGDRPLTPLLDPVPQVLADSFSGFSVAEAASQCNGCGEVRNPRLC